MDTGKDWTAAVGEKIAVVFLTPQCNMTCTFCVTQDNFQALSMQQAFRLLRTLQAAGVGNVILGGGEPFFWRPGALELAAYAKSLGLFLQVGTNAVNMPLGYATTRLIDRFILPLESMSESVHDSMRKHHRGHHSIIMEKLLGLGSSGKSVTVSTVVTRHNIGCLPEIKRFLTLYHARYRNLHAWHLYQLLEVGRGGSVNGPYLQVGPGEYDRACAGVRAQDSGIRIIKRPDMLNSASVGFFWLKDGELKSRSPYPVDTSGWAGSEARTNHSA